MASIKINNLQLAGADLFNDSESYLNELNESELSFTNGGSSPLCVTLGITIGTNISIGITASIYILVYDQ